MALNISTTIDLEGGVQVPSGYGVVSVNLRQGKNDVYVIDVQVRIYKDKASFDAGESELSIKVDSIPREPRFIKAFGITQGQYSTLDMSTIHTALINLLEDGDSDGNWNPDWGTWAGLGATTVTAVDLL